jgi:ribosomal protein L37E
MKIVKCIKCGDKTTNTLTKECDTCKIKKIMKEQKGVVYSNKNIRIDNGDP